MGGGRGILGGKKVGVLRGRDLEWGGTWGPGVCGDGGLGTRGGGGRPWGRMWGPGR